MATSFGAFLLGALVSLSSSWLLVSRLERIAIILGVPDGIWANSIHIAFLTAVAAVAIACVAGALLANRLRV